MSKIPLLVLRIGTNVNTLCGEMNVASLGERSGVHSVLVGKPEGKRPVGRPRRRRKDNIKMDLQEVGCGGMD